MKYVIFENHSQILPVVFPDHITHSDIKIENAKPVSAGFVDVSYGGFCTVYGKSTSLKLDSRPVDSSILEDWYRNSGMYAFLKPVPDVV